MNAKKSLKPTSINIRCSFPAFFPLIRKISIVEAFAPAIVEVLKTSSKSHLKSRRGCALLISKWVSYQHTGTRSTIHISFQSISYRVLLKSTNNTVFVQGPFAAISHRFFELFRYILLVLPEPSIYACTEST